MRRLLLATLALAAPAALAQTPDRPRTVEREVIVEHDDDGRPMVRRTVIINGDTTVDVRRGTAAEVFDRDHDVFIEEGDDVDVLLDGEVDLEVEDGDGRDGRAVRLRVEREGDHVTVRQGDGDDANVVRLRMPSIEGLRVLADGDGPELLREMMTGSGVSPETRSRMRALDREARQIARRARSAQGAEREAAVRELDGVLAELFEVRGEARRQEAAHLRERAAALEAEADEMDAATRDRAARRRAVIDARRAELLGDRVSDW